MKKIMQIMLFFTLLLVASHVKAQLDTLQYLKKFEVEKAEYINKPFSYLLGQMTQLQPKTVWFELQINRKSRVRTSFFKFCLMDHSFNKNSISLNITWQDEILYSQIKYYHDLNHFYFTNDERQFYGNKIVKNIEVVR
ncbi:hypothetical protein BWK58_07335 [Flavobacterium columnare]|nr:hypothetical protein BWK58_07335 [Flavobacterium columnare]